MYCSRERLSSWKCFLHLVVAAQNTVSNAYITSLLLLYFPCCYKTFIFISARKYNVLHTDITPNQAHWLWAGPENQSRYSCKSFVWHPRVHPSRNYQLWANWCGIWHVVCGRDMLRFVSVIKTLILWQKKEKKRKQIQQLFSTAQPICLLFSVHQLNLYCVAVYIWDEKIFSEIGIGS
jgi:hypothetical protein